MLLEELATATTAVHEQHATQLIESDHHQNLIEKIKETNRVPIMINNNEWKDEKLTPISIEIPSNLQNLQYNYPSNVEYQQAKIISPSSILAREQYEHIENNNQEIVKPIEQLEPYNRLVSTYNSNNGFNDESAHVKKSLDNQQILCLPIDNHLDDEQVSSLSDDSLLAEHHQNPHVHINETKNLETPIHSTSPLKLNYPQQNEELNLPWQRVFDQEFSNEYQRVQSQIEQASQLVDGSKLLRHQPQSNMQINEPKIVRSTAVVTLNYAHHNQELIPSWQQASDDEFSNQHQNLQQNLQIQSDEALPRYLPIISSAANEQSLKESDNYVNEFFQVPLLHENVRIENITDSPLVPSTQITQSRPIYRVQQQQISPNSENEYATITSMHTAHAGQVNSRQITEATHLVQPPIPIDIEVRLRPTYSETSSLVDMESFLNRFEESLEPEQHLPLIDQISLTYTTSIRTTHDETQRAIERYEEKHPYFSRALPLEWLKPTTLPHDEQLVEQWIVERNLETIQQQVELRTNNECEGVVIAAAIANDAYCINERFEEEITHTVNTKLTDHNDQEYNHMLPAIIISHCSPTSDYETDSLDKDNDTTSTTTSIDAAHIFTTPATTTLPSQSSDIAPNIPVDYFLDTLANENRNKTTKDFLLTIGFGQHEEKFHRAKINEIESEDNTIIHNFDENQKELLNIFFEPAHFHLPIIDEPSTYQLSFHNPYPILDEPNHLLSSVQHDNNLASNECITNKQQILSIAHINNQSDNEEELKSISLKYEEPSYIEHYHIQSLNPFSETLYADIAEPPEIQEHEDDHSASSILPDVVPSTTTTAITTTTIIEHEVIHADTDLKKGDAHMHVYLYDQSNKLSIVNQCRMI